MSIRDLVDTAVVSAVTRPYAAAACIVLALAGTGARAWLAWADRRACHFANITAGADE